MFRDTLDNDIHVGVSIYFMLTYCNVETLRLFVFHDLLLEWKGTRTVLQATKNNMELSSIKEFPNQENVKQFYESMVDILKLELGQVLAAISRPYEIEELVRVNSAFFKNTESTSDLGNMLSPLTFTPFRIPPSEHPPSSPGRSRRFTESLCPDPLLCL